MGFFHYLYFMARPQSIGKLGSFNFLSPAYLELNGTNSLPVVTETSTYEVIVDKVSLLNTGIELFSVRIGTGGYFRFRLTFISVLGVGLSDNSFNGNGLRAWVAYDFANLIDDYIYIKFTSIPYDSRA